MKTITVCIPTHALKIEQIGPYKNYKQTNYTAPSTKLVETAINSVSKKLTEYNLKFIIGLDHKLDDNISVDYLTNLKKIECSNIKVTCVESKLEDKPLTTVTATKNFYNLVDLCESDYFLLWEHDWVFNSDIDQEQLNIFDLDADMIRFNQNANVELHGEHLWIDEKTNRLFTDYYCNNPFLTSKKFWYDKIVPIANEIPDWWGEYGAFIEGPMKRYRDNQLKYEDTKNKYLNEYRICLYGKLNEESVISHLNGQVWSGT